MKRSRKLLNYSIAFLVSSCCICMAGAIGITASDLILSTPTPAQIANTSIPIEIIIAETFSAAQTQTMQANPPALISTNTPAPQVDLQPTATIFIFQLQTDVARPTEYIFSTNTPFTLSTATLIRLPNATPTLPQSSACNAYYPTVCLNDNPRLNCSDLAAKGIQRFKVLQPDPLNYDKDADGIGCE